jgi:hypothetical protein
MIQEEITKDTLAVIEYDSALVNNHNQKQIILIKEPQNKNEKGWYENTLLVSFLYPALTAVLILLVTKKLNKKKNLIEREKINEDISKIRAETDSIKKSFQPIVIGTLQSVQEEIISSKIDSLKKLVKLKNEFVFFEQQFFEGDPVVPNFNGFLKLLYSNFSYIKFDEFKKYHDEYSYLFPNNVFDILKKLRNELAILNGNKKSFDSVDDGDIEPSKKDCDQVRKIIDLYDDAIFAIRKDCHLDTSLIHEFIEQNI